MSPFVYYDSDMVRHQDQKQLSIKRIHISQQVKITCLNLVYNLNDDICNMSKADANGDKKESRKKNVFCLLSVFHDDYRSCNKIIFILCI